MPRRLSPELRQFIADHVDSARALSVLLHLRSTPRAALSAAEVALELRLPEAAVETDLERFAALGLVVRADQDGRHAYGPADANAARLVEELAGAYASNRVAVVGAIYSGASDDALGDLSDAFRLRGRRL